MSTTRHLAAFFIAAAALLPASITTAERTAVKVLAPPKKPLAAKDIPEPGSRTKSSASLGIPDRAQGPNAPSAGWCGESAIQQAMLFYGAWMPQALINKAGNPTHPDLYASDIPVALRQLGLAFERSPQFAKLDGYLTWLRGQVKAGVPVLVGVKLHPTKHPRWGLDHFVIVEGFDAENLVLNTTWDEQQKRSDAKLKSNKEGISFNNGGKGQYALSITGPKQSLPGEVRARMIVEKENEKVVEVVVKCEGLQKGRHVIVSRSESFTDKGEAIAAFEANGEAYAFRLKLEPDEAAVIRCLQLEE